MQQLQAISGEIEHPSSNYLQVEDHHHSISISGENNNPTNINNDSAVMLRFLAIIEQQQKTIDRLEKRVFELMKKNIK